MSYQKLIVLLPCHSLDDFPTHCEGQEAEGLLSAWTSLWHPALIAAAGVAPTWERADLPPDELDDACVVIPPRAENYLQTGFVARAQSARVTLIRHQHHRPEVLRAALEPLGDAPPMDADVVGDFLALGYATLQIELLTRHMRYASQLDEIHFHRLVVEAARAAAAGEPWQEKLAAAFDLLGEQRDHYYPVDAHLIDLVLTAPTTLGPELRRQLAGPYPFNLLADAQFISRLAETDPDALAQLRAALADERIGLVGGARVEQPWALMSLESVLDDLVQGLRLYEQLLGRRPRVFGRREFGLGPLVPQILQKTGFIGTLHMNLAEGRVPEGSQLKTRWEGADGSAIDALARPPGDASQAATFLALATRLGESMDIDHVAGLCLAHWPSRTSPWYEDLRRAARYTSALGRFTTLEKFFHDTTHPGHLDRFEADQYRSPVLSRSVERQASDPISRWVRYWRDQALELQLNSFRALTTLIRPPGRTPGVGEPPIAKGEVVQTGQTLADQVAAAARQLAEALPRQPGPPEDGCLVLNPYSGVRRQALELSGGEPAAAEPPLYVAERASDGKLEAVVDVPPLGFAWIAPRDAPARARRAKPPQLLAEEFELRNEFFEAQINPTTGSLLGLFPIAVRGNRMSQQLAMRLPDRSTSADDESRYSVMAADEVRVERATAVHGEIVSRGRLLDRQGQPLAGFVQRYRVSRGSRVLWIDIELDVARDPGPEPWQSYYACRFAWPGESAELFRCEALARLPTSARRLQSPHYVEVVDADARLTILAGGLPYHRRVGDRILDTLLVVAGESARTFRLGLAVDLPQPLLESFQALAPPAVLHQRAAAPSPASNAWLFHLDARNVVATHWEALLDDGRVVGLRTRLMEVAGRPVQLHLSSFRPLESARQLTFLGEPLAPCRIVDGRARLELAGGEWVQLEARFA